MWAVAALALVLAAAGQFAIDRVPYVVQQPGYYLLTQDLNSSDYIAIVVNASGVVLDGGGHYLFGAGGYIGIYVVNAANVTVKDVKVAGFSYGILLENTTEARLLNIWVFRNARAGVEVDLSRQIRVESVRAEDNGEVGVRLYFVNGSILRDVVANGNGCGVSIDGALGVLAERLNVSDNECDGLVVGDSADVVVSQVVADRNAGSGVFIGSKNVELAQLSARGNSESGLVLLHADNARVRDVDAEGNGYSGVEVVKSRRVSLSRVSAVGNEYDGLSISFSEEVEAFNSSFVGNEVGAHIGRSSRVRLWLNNFVNNTWLNIEVCESSVELSSPGPLTYIYRGAAYFGRLGNYWSDSPSAGGLRGIGAVPYMVAVRDCKYFSALNYTADYFPLESPSWYYRLIAETPCRRAMGRSWGPGPPALVR
ncbi:NosD domain-containing protein [Thermoproteus tenax]|uniref:Cell suface protein containing PKD-like repeats n=1 Tax=Thermoproteus tenax (strain ATCC 35583 / DSM 2078 / JCM 9277 / NBRC 100435 / Kra 1) TaxID=768679 RepID=G4RK01_THETK|nr:NosD domain-containing protein [Thermoproteus tenax]CCC81896.1 cell suface protein containing PKD-like repeats [Thermoproteus tenax Kra 1]